MTTCGCTMRVPPGNGTQKISPLRITLDTVEYYHISLFVSLFDIAVGFGNVFESKTSVDDRLEFSLFAQCLDTIQFFFVLHEPGGCEGGPLALAPAPQHHVEHDPHRGDGRKVQTLRRKRFFAVGKISFTDGVENH